MDTLVHSAPLKIIFIEDEKPLLDALREVFRDDYHVSAFTKIADALSWIKAGNAFDVIVCDLNLPDKTGRDLYEILKAEGHGDEKKIVFMTGGIFTADLADWYNSIPNKKFEKPFNIRGLRELLDNLN